MTIALLNPSNGQNPIGFLDWPGSDKLIHTLSFLIFSMTFCLSQRITSLLIVLLLGSGYGIILELIQIIVPERSFELLDWVADSTGTILGYLAFIALRRRKI